MSPCSTPVVILKNSVSPSGESTFARVSSQFYPLRPPVHLCGNAIGLERLSSVDRIEGFSKVDECDQCPINFWL